MHGSQPIILASAATIAVVHTVIGIDHYLPFIVLSRAGGWSLRKTLAWTFVCGLGHVLSSVALGLLGVGLGWALSSLQRFESVRGEIAGIALIGFGVVYLAWGLWRGRRGHTHVHVHADGSLHSHPHDHPGVEPAPHESPEHVSAHNRTLWVLFTIFVLGPCEPLIPLLIAPASRHDAAGVASVAAFFGAITIVTMLGLVALGTVGVRLVRLERLERHAHALAGLAILVSGLLIRLFDL